MLQYTHCTHYAMIISRLCFLNLKNLRDRNGTIFRIGKSTADFDFLLFPSQTTQERDEMNWLNLNKNEQAEENGENTATSEIPESVQNTSQPLPPEETPAENNEETTSAEENAPAVPVFDGAAFLQELKEIKEILSARRDEFVTIDRKDAIITNLHDELVKHRKGFKQDIMLPLVKSVIDFTDRLAALEKIYRNKFAEIENLPDAAGELLQEIGYTRESVIDVLALFDYVEVIPECGTAFSAKEHKCIGTRPAESEEQVNTIAEVLKTGITNDNSGQIIRYPEVVIFK